MYSSIFRRISTTQIEPARLKDMENSNIEQIFNSVALRESMLSLFPSFINMQFTYNQRRQLVEYMNCVCLVGSINADQEIATLWEISLNSANSECWAIFMSRPKIVCDILAEGLDDLADGRCTVEDMAQNICREVVSILVRTIADDSRDINYAGLREAISRIKKDNINVFITTVHRKYNNLKKYVRGMGVLFSPEHVGADYPEYTRDKMEEPLSSISDVDPTIRKLKRTPLKDGGHMQMIWNWDIVEVEAKRYWQAFVDERNFGKPIFVPLYAMYCWIKKSISFGINPSDRIDMISDDGDNRVESATNDVLNESEPVLIEDQAFHEEVESLANDFSHSLTDREKILCIILSEPDGTMEKVAKAIGLSKPSSVTSIKKSFYGKLREFFSKYSELRAVDELFLKNVIDACKKEGLAPKI